jgi:exopolyphosphatase/guanosine-5'-triphosphate,3'-diphosphate pyrophosphatase
MTRMRSAVLDLGSSSFHLLIADVTADGGITPILREREFLNLGLQLVGDGRIARSSASRAVETVRRFRALVERSGADRCLPVATSALRDASNGAELAHRLEDAAGVPIRSVDGADEARLMFAGVVAGVAHRQPTVLAMDLGGGSLEIAGGDRGGVVWTGSLPFGAARASASLVSDPPARDERRSLKRSVREALEPFARRVVPEQTSYVVCGGTARALAKIDAVDRWGSLPPSVNQHELTADRLRELARRLAGSVEPV